MNSAVSDPVSRQYNRPVNPPVSRSVSQPPANEELIIFDYKGGRYEFNNRWKYDDVLVHYGSIEHWDGSRLWMNCSQLNRIKIYGLDRQPIASLLARLSEDATRLQELEIDTLQLLTGSQTEYTFKDLQLLSVDCVRVVDHFGQPTIQTEMPPPLPTVKFKAKRLTKVFLGSDSIEYLLFSHLHRVKYLEIDQDPNRRLLKFRHLQTLVCNEICQIDLEVLDKFVRREVGLLSELHCNLARLTCTSYQPLPAELAHLKLLFQTLERYHYPRDLRTFQNDVRLKVKVELFIHAVKVKFDRSFENYRFGERLIEMHWHNLVNNGFRLIACPTVTKVDYLPLVPLSMSIDGLFGTSDLRALHFGQLYPNCQRVYLCRQNECFSPEDFYWFLDGCIALRELKISRSGFGQRFYEELCELKSVQTLTEFYLIEGIEYNERLNFDFVQNLRHLRLFGTNVATKSVMIKLVERMRPLSSFDFQFLKPSENFYCECIVEKRSTSQLELILGQRNPIDPLDNTKATAIRVIMDASKAAVNLASGALCPFSHWLDDLP